MLPAEAGSFIYLGDRSSRSTDTNRHRRPGYDILLEQERMNTMPNDYNTTNASIIPNADAASNAYNTPNASAIPNDYNATTANAAPNADAASTACITSTADAAPNADAAPARTCGFTLAELLVVVAIIAVLVMVSIPIFTAQLEKSREAVDLSNLRSAYGAGKYQLMEIL